MTNIEKVGKKVSEFLKETLNTQCVEVIKIHKKGEIWETEAEVYEDSSFIKSLGLPAKVKDHHFYDVIINDELEVQAYERRSGEKC